ncbi:MAG: aminotransferase class III-fold pyridoxal phosphate-dependent enzyme [Candidatus Aminicenantes bacterium]|nr:aminotransferase class III-fold pyridoxal phosphate-dependent enzyme [Candidatus Aminicenantes bacterium]
MITTMSRHQQSMLRYKPKFSEPDAAAIAKNMYAVQAEARTLPGERDQNFLLTTAAGERFVLKIAHAGEEWSMLETQNQVLRHLEKRLSFCPRVVAAQNGKFIAEMVTADSNRHFVRLLSYLPGRPLATVKKHRAGLMVDLGRRLGEISRALADMDIPGFRRDFHWNLAQASELITEYLPLVKDPSLHDLLEKGLVDFIRHAGPLLPALRCSVIFNDANDHNILVGGAEDLLGRDPHVTGVIDFGDMVYSYTVGDLAVAIAYAVLDKPDPLSVAVQVVSGFHAVFPVEEKELAVLFDLVRLRLSLSVCLAVHQQQQRPEDEYLSISQDAIRRTLPRLFQINRRFATARFRVACGQAALQWAAGLYDWLRKNQPNMAPVMGRDLRSEPLLVFDLGIASPLMAGDPGQISETELGRRLFSAMDRAGVKIGIGRYNEARLLYTSPLFVKGDLFDENNRTVHLGMDVFMAAGAPVYAPLDGDIFAFSQNRAALDYGPVIILRHHTKHGDAFYTLYGHLSLDSLSGLQVGQAVKKGQIIARIGSADVNGGWPPHLHFQIILDLLEMGCDFPGVASPAERELWCQLSPDPNLILAVPEKYFPAPEPTKMETLAVRQRRIAASVKVTYREPVKIVRGWMQYLFDETGRRYLDAYNNVPHVGHCHPAVVAAAQQQMSILNTNTRYLHDTINRFAESLCATLPEPLRVCFFVNSASEGNELALRLARAYTGRRDMVVLAAAYHGHTTSLIDISPYKHAGPGGQGAPDWVHVATLADGYRGEYKADDFHAGVKYAARVEDIIHSLQRKDRAPAAFIAESCPSVGGQIFFPPGYLSAVYCHIRQAGGVCIADDVQTAYGRIGSHFYAFEKQGVVPDIVVLGKPIGNGHPLSAVITTAEIAAAFDNGMEFFSTFGGNPVSCAVGEAVLKIVQDEHLMEHALTVGEHLLGGLQPLLERYAMVGDVRGSGLFLGVELVKDRRSLQPAAEAATFVVERMRELGVLIGTDGPFHNVLKIRPPMPFNSENAEFLLASLDRVLAENFVDSPEP